MEYNDYLNLVSSRLTSHYDLTEGFAVGSLAFDLAAKFVIKNERYLFSRHVATIDSCHNTTLCLVKKIPGRLSAEAITEAQTCVTQELVQLVNPREEHMSTTVNLILVTDGVVERETVRTVEQYQIGRAHV